MKSGLKILIALAIVLSLALVAVPAVPGGSTQPIAQTNDNMTNAVTGSVSVTASATSSTTIYYFWKTGCGHCAIAAPFMKSMETKYKSYTQITFLEIDIKASAANYALFKQFNAEFNTGSEVTPTLFIRNMVVLIGENAIMSNLESYILKLIGSSVTPAAPQNVVATAGNANIKLTWTAPYNGGSAITGYKIYRSTVSGSETLWVTLGAVTTYTNTALTNGVTYYYKVSAINAKGEGPKSAEVQAKPTTVPTASGVPGTVTGLSATATGASGVIKLTWTEPSNGGSAITGYKIYRAWSSGTEKLVATISPATSYTNSWLTNGVTYYYKVSAVNAKGEGPLSAEVHAAPAIGSPVAPPTASGVPGTVTGLSATATGASGVIKLTWTAPSNGGSAITGYKIYRGWSSGFETLVKTISPGTAYTDSWMTNGVTYYYKVSAVNANGEGPLSAEVHAAPHA